MIVSTTDLGMLPVLSHAGTGSSSVTDTTRLPLDNLIEPRTLVPCRFTTTAVTTDAAPNNRMILTYDFGKTVTGIVVGVLGHNIASDDEFMVSIDGGAYTDFDMSKIDFLAAGPVFASYGGKKSAFVYYPDPMNTIAFRFAAGNSRVIGAAPPKLEIGRLWLGRGQDYSDLFGSAWSMRLIDGGKTDLSRVGGMFFSPATILRELTMPLPAMPRSQLVPAPYLDSVTQPAAPSWLNLVRAAGMTREIIVMPREFAPTWPRERMSVYGLLSASAQASQAGLAGIREDQWNASLTVLERR